MDSHIEGKPGKANPDLGEHPEPWHGSDIRPVEWCYASAVLHEPHKHHGEALDQPRKDGHTKFYCKGYPEPGEVTYRHCDTEDQHDPHVWDSVSEHEPFWCEGEVLANPPFQPIVPRDELPITLESVGEEKLYELTFGTGEPKTNGHFVRQCDENEAHVSHFYTHNTSGYQTSHWCNGILLIGGSHVNEENCEFARIEMVHAPHNWLAWYLGFPPEETTILFCNGHASALKRRDGDQPLPSGVGENIQTAVMHDLDARLELGITRYGQGLKVFNGRDMLRDAYEEAMDLTVYLKGARKESLVREYSLLFHYSKVDDVRSTTLLEEYRSIFLAEFGEQIDKYRLWAAQLSEGALPRVAPPL